MKLKLPDITLALLILFAFTFTSLSCSSQGSKNKERDSIHDTAVLKNSEESTSFAFSDTTGQSYIDSFIFIGESTTYHMKNREVLSGGKNTKQIWAPRSGTMMLDLGVGAVKIVFPETGEEISFYEAAKRKKPRYVLMTFGLNGAVQNVARGEEYFKKCYKILIDEIKRGSPDTKIILQSAFPVAENMDMSNYSVDLGTLNRYIDLINSWTHSLADELDLTYLDTSEILKDEKGNLRIEYQSGDGHHLTKSAYEAILAYIRTHKET